MASRKDLKQAIHTEIEEMLFDLSVLHSIAPAEQQGEIEQLIVEALDTEVETISKISHTNGRGNDALVRAYYRDLRADYETFARKMSDEVERLFTLLAAPQGAND